ncbi:MAG: hypothetical protein ACI4D7_01270, partial [Lachnospiraceae bacterium]
FSLISLGVWIFPLSIQLFYPMCPSDSQLMTSFWFFSAISSFPCPFSSSHLICNCQVSLISLGFWIFPLSIQLFYPMCPSDSQLMTSFWIFLLFSSFLDHFPALISLLAARFT